MDSRKVYILKRLQELLGDEYTSNLKMQASSYLVDQDNLPYDESQLDELSEQIAKQLGGR